MKSIICLFNYWKFKRSINVRINAITRNLKGEIIKEEFLEFDRLNLLNYSCLEGKNFEGSIEFEFFSEQDPFIPIAAGTAVYETKKSITHVHSYSFRLPLRQFTIANETVKGYEGGWAICDTDSKKSFAILHNGESKLTNQTWILEITNFMGEKISREISLNAIEPYETIKIFPSDYIDNLDSFLEEKSGFASLEFHLSGTSTRMLIGHILKNGSDLQVTHSHPNFYKISEIENAGRLRLLLNSSRAGFYTPKITDVYTSAQTLPDMEDGTYLFYKKMQTICFSTGQFVEWDHHDPATFLMRTDGKLPKQVAACLSGKLKNSKSLPFECSMQAVYKYKNPRNYWWGLFAFGGSLKSRLIIMPMTELYEYKSPDQKVTITFYHNALKEIYIIEKKLSDFSHHNEIFIDNILKRNNSFINDRFGHFSVQCDYSGLMIYSTIENQYQSLSLEHSF